MFYNILHDISPQPALLFCIFLNHLNRTVSAAQKRGEFAFLFCTSVRARIPLWRFRESLWGKRIGSSAITIFQLQIWLQLMCEKQLWGSPHSCFSSFSASKYFLVKWYTSFYNGIYLKPFAAEKITNAAPWYLYMWGASHAWSRPIFFLSMRPKWLLLKPCEACAAIHSPQKQNPSCCWEGIREQTAVSYRILLFNLISIFLGYEEFDFGNWVLIQNHLRTFLLLQMKLPRFCSRCVWWQLKSYRDDVLPRDHFRI